MVKRINIKINLTDRVYYTFIALGVIILLGFSVVAYSGNVGHTSDQIDVQWSQISGVPADILDGDDIGTNMSTGMVMMWSGAISSIPFGWQLCDGTGGTPNLQDNFVVGAGLSYNVGDTGGNSTVKLTEAQMPSHSHSFTLRRGGGTSGAYSDFGYITSSKDTDMTGGDQPHENRPPYYALAYICKV